MRQKVTAPQPAEAGEISFEGSELRKRMPAFSPANGVAAANCWKVFRRSTEKSLRECARPRRRNTSRPCSAHRKVSENGKRYPHRNAASWFASRATHCVKRKVTWAG